MQTHAVYLLNHLGARRYRAAVLTYQPTRDTELQHWWQIDAAMPFPVHRILSRIGFWASAKKIETFARCSKPDVIYCSTVFPGFVGTALNVPVLCRFVGNDVMRSRIAWPFKSLSRVLSSATLERPLFDFYERCNAPEWVERFAR